MEQIIFVTDEHTKTPEEVAGVLSFQGSFTLKRSRRNYHEYSKSAGLEFDLMSPFGDWIT